MSAAPIIPTATDRILREREGEASLLSLTVALRKLTHDAQTLALKLVAAEHVAETFVDRDSAIFAALTTAHDAIQRAQTLVEAARTRAHEAESEACTGCGAQACELTYINNGDGGLCLGCYESRTQTEREN